jgi:Protein of unknown function (DUF3800)
MTSLPGALLQQNQLQLVPDTLLIFLDETGDEKYSDPKHPVFGIGGCALTSNEYASRMVGPWEALKNDVLGLAGQPFHAVDFERARRPRQQRHAEISAINQFLMRSFYRLAVTTDINTKRPAGFDGHATVSTVIFEYIRRLIARHTTRRCMVFFEHTHRCAELLERNLPIHTMDARNLIGERVMPEGFTMPKTSMEAGLEIADLIIHTSVPRDSQVGRSATRKLAGLVRRRAGVAQP